MPDFPVISRLCALKKIPQGEIPPLRPCLRVLLELLAVRLLGTLAPGVRRNASGPVGTCRAGLGGLIRPQRFAAFVVWCGRHGFVTPAARQKCRRVGCLIQVAYCARGGGGSPPHDTD